MSAEIHPQSTIFVIFGIGGDLARRKLIPALYDLFLDQWLPEKFLVIGLGHKSQGDKAFIEDLRQGVIQFSRRKEIDGRQWKAFAAHLTFQNADFDAPSIYLQQARQFSTLDQEAFKVPSPEAYETLLLDVMLGNATLFMRADQAEAAWTVITPILEAWEAVVPANFPNYQAGTWGPESAEHLIARDGRSWLMPNLHHYQEAMLRCEVVEGKRSVP